MTLSNHSRENTLDCQGRPSIITIIKILIKGRREVDKDDIRTDAEVKGKRRCYAAGFEDRKESQAKECRWSLETGKGKERNGFFPKPSEEMQTC